jgi:hypothetical protein
MNEKQVDAFLERHGLADHVGMYGGAIELDRHGGPEGMSSMYWDSYAFLSRVIEKAKEEAIQSFGDEVV